MELIDFVTDEFVDELSSEYSPSMVNIRRRNKECLRQTVVDILTRLETNGKVLIPERYPEQTKALVKVFEKLGYTVSRGVIYLWLTMPDASIDERITYD